MLPGSFVVLDAMPLNSSGKIDRSALPLPSGKVHTTVAYQSPQTATEKEIAAIWEELLRVKQIGIHDNFFELGGHSLLASRLVARLNDVYSITLPIGEMFARQNVHALSRFIDREVKLNMALRSVPEDEIEPNKEEATWEI